MYDQWTLTKGVLLEGMRVPGERGQRGTAVIA